VVFSPLMVFVFHAQCAGSPPGVHPPSRRRPLVITRLPPLTPPLLPPRPPPPPHPLTHCWSPDARRERLADFATLSLRFCYRASWLGGFLSVNSEFLSSHEATTGRGRIATDKARCRRARSRLERSVSTDRTVSVFSPAVSAVCSKA